MPFNPPPPPPPYLGNGSKKPAANYPLFGEKQKGGGGVGGRQGWISSHNRETIQKKQIIVLVLIKVDKGKGEHRLWIKKFPYVNIINFAKVDKGGGGKTLIHI